MPSKPPIEHIAMPERNPGDDLRDLLLRQVRASGGDPSQLLELIELTIKSRLWEVRGFSFAEFIATPYSQGGLGWSIENLRGIMRLEHRYEATNAEIKARMNILRQEVERLLSPPARKVGRPKKNDPGKGSNTTFSGITNAEKGSNTTFSSITDDRSRIYHLRRLQRDRPDLAAQVLSGQMTPYEAAITAGFRKRSIHVYPDDLDRTLAALRRHFNPEALAVLAGKLLNIDD